NFTFANSTSYSSNNKNNGWSSKDFSTKMASRGKDGNVTESSSSAKEVNFDQFGNQKQMSEQFGFHQMWNDSTQYQEQFALSDGSENSTDSKHEYHEGSNLDADHARTKDESGQD